MIHSYVADFRVLIYSKTAKFHTLFLNIFRFTQESKDAVEKH